VPRWEHVAVTDGARRPTRSGEVTSGVENLCGFARADIDVSAPGARLKSACQHSVGSGWLDQVEVDGATLREESEAAAARNAGDALAAAKQVGRRIGRRQLEFS